MAPLIWLVTGCTTGLGKSMVESIASGGDRVIATGRNAEKRLHDLKSDNVAVLDLDITMPKVVINAQVQKAIGIFGGLDVLVNNAGASWPSTVEEADDDFMHRIFDVNVYGTMRVTQSVLPHFRGQKSEKIVFMGSCVAWGPLPFFSHYAAAKAALDVLVEGLQKEVASFGMKTACIASGSFATDLGVPREGEAGAKPPSLPEYASAFGQFFADFGSSFVFNDKTKFATFLVDLVHGQGKAAGRPWPSRICIGPDALMTVRQRCKQTFDLAEAWADVARSMLPNGQELDPNPKVLTLSALPTQWIRSE
ncbi:hypothetical protein F5X99DRAFT_430981 [Biscogniauxia marginata]|nr:hypothetical protein F5X99DRAFT_430981 [Biscogniauxia marginata]